MHDIHVRPANTEDLPRMFALWKEKHSLTHQAISVHASGMPDLAEWSATAQTWLVEPNLLLAAMHGEQVIGLLHARFDHSDVTTCVIEDLILDLHGYYPGAARGLVEALKAMCIPRGIRTLMISSGRRLAVESAFWHSIGAQRRDESEMELLWLNV